MRGRTFLMEFAFFACIILVYVRGWIYSVERREEIHAGYVESRAEFGWEEGSYEWVTLGIKFAQTVEEVDARMAAIAERTAKYEVFRDMKEEGMSFDGMINQYTFEHHVNPESEGFVHELYTVWFDSTGGAVRMRRSFFGAHGYFEPDENFCEVDLWTGEIMPTNGQSTLRSRALVPSDANQPMRCGNRGGS